MSKTDSNPKINHSQQTKPFCLFTSVTVFFKLSCLSSEGMSKKAGAQTGSGFIPAETSPTPHEIPAAVKGNS